MEFKLTVGFNKETLSVMETLAAALSGQFTVAAQEAEAPQVKTEAKAKETPAKKAAAAKDVKADDEPVYWYCSTEGTRGIAASEAEFQELKKADPKTVKHTKEMYESGLKKEAAEEKEAKTKAEVAKQAKAEAAKAAKAEAEAAKEAAEEEQASQTTEVDVPSEADVIAAFSAYLSTDLSDEDKAARRPVVKAILDRFGAKRATLLTEDSRALAINLVERAAAGEEIDPENDEFQELEDGLL